MSAWVAGRSIERFKGVGRRLAAVRHEAGLSQKQLAERLNRPPSFVAKLELAERRVDIIDLEALASALGLEPAQLLTRLLAD